MPASRISSAAVRLLALWLLAVTGHAQTAPDTLPPRCETLLGLHIPARVISLPTEGGRITEAVRVEATARSISDDGEIVLERPAHCRLQGRIFPLDPQAPPIRFNINMPNAWNGKAMHSGGGGLGGRVNTAPGEKGSGRFDPQPVTDPYPLTDGYVTFGSDDGHRAGDVSFIANDEALRNWAGEALRKTRDAAVWLIEHAYDRTPNRIYFNGESAGGREAVYVAQRWPRAYDGVIAVTPVLSWTYIHIADNRIRSRLIDGWLDAEAIELIADATRAACDADDGLEDGILARYMDCAMDSQALRCSGDGRPCLSDAQIAALDAIRQPWSFTVPHAHGVERYPGFGITGDEDNPRNQYATYTVGTVPPIHPLPPGDGFQQGLGGILNFGAVWVRHAIVQNEAFDPYRFYPAPHLERIQYLSGLFDATDPDLSAFRERGGKMIIMQQSADNAVGTPMVAEYYRSVVGTLGTEAADDVIRLYVGPGGTHNGSGVAQADLISLLEAWVERGEAPPDAIPAFDIDPRTLETKRSMPACLYPRYAHYDGAGDPLDSGSFSCADRADPLGYHGGR